MNEEREYLKRMRIELSDLTTKRDKAFEFVYGPKSEGKLNAAQRYLLQKQIDAMSEYASILNARIAIEEGKANHV